MVITKATDRSQHIEHGLRLFTWVVSIWQCTIGQLLFCVTGVGVYSRLSMQPHLYTPMYASVPHAYGGLVPAVWEALGQGWPCQCWVEQRTHIITIYFANKYTLHIANNNILCSWVTVKPRYTNNKMPWLYDLFVRLSIMGISTVLCLMSRA